jgi:hypothetical protein
MENRQLPIFSAGMTASSAWLIELLSKMAALSKVNNLTEIFMIHSP